MKYIFNLFMFIVITLCANSVSAQQCASLTLSPYEVNGNKKVSVISGHNGKAIELAVKRAEVSGLTNDGYTYYLEPGVHSFRIEEWDKRSYIKYQKSVSKFATVTEMRTNTWDAKVKSNKRSILLTVKAGQNYELKPALDTFDAPVLVKPMHNSCENEELIYSAQRGPVQVQTSQFPNSLEYRLRYMMFKLHKNNISNNYIPINDASYLGVTFALSGNVDGIKVLSSSPYSLMIKLTLASGDKITAIGKTQLSGKIDSPVEVFNGYLDSLTYGENIELTVSRKGKSIQLTMQYLPNFIPESSFSITKGANGKVPSAIELKKLAHYEPSLAFEYEQLLLEIEAYYSQSENVLNHNVVIKRPESTTPFLGIGLKNTTSGGGVITNVIKQSQSDVLGLAKGDVLIELNNVELMKKSAREIAKQFINTDFSEPVTMIVLRDGDEKTLKSNGVVVRLPAFELSLDLLTTNQTRNQILTAIEQGAYDPEAYLELYELRVEGISRGPKPQVQLRSN